MAKGDNKSRVELSPSIQSKLLLTGFGHYNDYR